MLNCRAMMEPVDAVRGGTAQPAFLRPIGIAAWLGASGRRFDHAIYSLIGCPAPVEATYLLVKRNSDGSRKVLAKGRSGQIASLDLARLRLRGARLGANEVHLHICREGDRERARIERDLADPREVD